MSPQMLDVKHPRQVPDGSHHVVVKLETIHVGTPELDPSFFAPGTHELIEYEFTPANSPEELDLAATRIREASIIITTTVPVNKDTLRDAPYLKCVIAESTGTNHIDLDECKKRGITVFFSPNATLEAVSEHALAMLTDCKYFSLRRRLIVLHNTMMQYTDGQANSWGQKGSMSGLLKDSEGQVPRTCESETAGIIGNGPIGQRIAKLCRNLGMKVLISARKSSGPATSAAPATTGSSNASSDATLSSSVPSLPCPPDRTPFAEVVRSSTVLFVVLPKTAETINTISAPELSAMRPDSVVINVGRGGLVDERALLAAVRSGAIYGGATDVFEKEPAGSDEDSVLLGREVAREGLNLCLTPHLAWCADTTKMNVKRVVGENLREYLTGGTRNVILEGRHGDSEP